MTVKCPRSLPLVEGIGLTLESFVIRCILLFLAITTVATMAVTAYLPNNNYQIVFNCQTGALVIAGCSAFLGAVILRKLRNSRRCISARQLMAILFVYASIFGFVWVSLADVWPEWDPADVFAAASTLNDVDSLSYGNGSYMERFPYQVPLVVIVKCLQKLFGDNAYYAFELINVFCAAATLCLVVHFASTLFKKKEVTELTAVLCATFFPLLLYSTFAYGNTICLPFCFGALLLQMQYYKTKQIRYALVSGLAVWVCVAIKSSMIVVLVAMLLSWLIHAFKERSVRSVVCFVGVLLIYQCGVFVVTTVSEQYMGIDTSEAMPKTAWIAMGLQETGEGLPENYGWFNGYIWTWPPDRYNPSVIAVESKESIYESLSKFVSDPVYATNFFVKKYCSEWCEPSFESLLASSWAGSNENRPIMANREMSPLVQSIYSGKINKAILFILDCWQTIVMAFAFVAVFLQRKKIGIEKMTPAMIAAGMALLYLIWEAQSQYVLPGYLMLIPYAALGLSLSSQWACSKIEVHQKSKKICKASS